MHSRFFPFLTPTIVLILGAATLAGAQGVPGPVTVVPTASAGGGGSVRPARHRTVRRIVRAPVTDDMDEIDTIEEDVIDVEDAAYALQLTGLVAHDGLATDTLGTLDITIANHGTDTSQATQVALSFRSDSSMNAVGRVAVPRIPPGEQITLHAQVPRTGTGVECYEARVEIPEAPEPVTSVEIIDSDR